MKLYCVVVELFDVACKPGESFFTISAVAARSKAAAKKQGVSAILHLYSTNKRIKYVSSFVEELTWSKVVALHDDYKTAYREEYEIFRRGGEPDNRSSGYDRLFGCLEASLRRQFRLEPYPNFYWWVTLDMINPA